MSKNRRRNIIVTLQNFRVLVCMCSLFLDIIINNNISDITLAYFHSYLILVYKKELNS